MIDNRDQSATTFYSPPTKRELMELINRRGVVTADRIIRLASHNNLPLAMVERIVVQETTVKA